MFVLNTLCMCIMCVWYYGGALMHMRYKFLCLCTYLGIRHLPPLLSIALPWDRVSHSTRSLIFFLDLLASELLQSLSLCPAVLESYLCTIMPGFIIIFMWVWGFELWSSFLYSPSQNTLSVIRNKCFSQKICKEHYFLFEKLFCWKKNYQSFSRARNDTVSFAMTEAQLLKVLIF